MGKIVTLDTNILLRASDKSSNEFDFASRTLSFLSENNIKVYLSSQVIYESWVVLTRPRSVNGLGLKIEEAYDFIQETMAFYECLTDSENQITIWLELVRNFKVIGVKSHDVRIVAWMLSHKIKNIISFNDIDFKSFPIKAIHPKNLTEIIL